MIKKILLIFICLFSQCCYAIEKNNTLQKFLDKVRSKYKIPVLSLSIQLSEYSTPITLISIDSNEKNKLSNSTTLFKVASITKTFTAFLIQHEIQNKKISLNDKLTKFLPEYPKWNNITIEQLLDHTSGIFDYIRSDGWWDNFSAHPNKIWKSHELVEIAYNHQPDFIAGSSWRYSNTNYVILGIILEKVEKNSLENLMRKLLRKTNLSNTYYVVKPYSSSFLNKIVPGYYQKNNMRSDQTVTNASWLQAAGALVSTTKDIVSWDHFFYNSDMQFRLKETTTGKRLDSFNHAGYSSGAFRMNTPEGLVWFTPGFASGYISMMAYAPCSDIYFAYSTDLAPLKDFHKEMMMGVLHQLNRNRHINNKSPNYCSDLKPTKQFEFPKLE